MSARAWQPGDAAMVKCSDGVWRQATCERRHSHEPDPWLVWRFPDGASRRCDASQARPLVVIDPEDDKQVKALADAYHSVDHAIGTMWLQRALRTVATLPTRDEPQDEPTDPGVRVRDKNGDEWARVEGDWVSLSAIPPFSWHYLQRDFGPLVIVQPEHSEQPLVEPTGLGAVVESEYGSLFVRDKVTTTKKHWKRAEGMDGSRRHAWADIRPTRVIQEGYTPPDAPDADVANDYYRRLKMGRPRPERVRAVSDLLGPDAPSADERPFKEGDCVDVSHDAVFYMDGVARRSPAAGQRGIVRGFSRNALDDYRLAISGSFIWVHGRFLIMAVPA